MKLLLDTHVLGQVCHPRKHEDVRRWLRTAVVHHDLLLSELADYELRRELLRIGASRSLARLDELTRELTYIPVTTATWRAAARLWAVLRRAGQPTTGNDRLDGDALLMAQAIAEDAVVVTPNRRHFASVVATMDWSEVPLG